MEKLPFVLRPVGLFLLATMFFYVGICQDSNARRIFAFLYTVAALFCLASLHNLPPDLATFFLGWVVHTSGLLLVVESSPRRFSLSSVDELKATFFLWINFRGISTRHDMDTPDHSSFRPRFGFAVRRTIRILSLLAFNYGMTELLVKPTLRSLGIIRSDFSPAKQGVVPPVQRKDLILRLIVSTLWIWKTYVTLTVSHDVFSVFFVSVLQWNDGSDWPSLFGSISDAVSISRFWGSFWHRLHVLPFLRFQPSVPYLGNCPPWICKNTMVRNGIRSFWIFLLSAVCHGALNHVVYGEAYLKAELRFFLCNWCVCLAETMWKRIRMGGEKHLDVSRAQNGAMGLLRRTGGYTFVLGFFFCTVPAWRYPLIFDSTQ
jgi:hypothetical protein